MTTTVEQFLKRSAEFNANKTTHWTNGTLDVIVNKLPISKIVSLQQESDSDFEIAKEVVYLSCPIFRDILASGQITVVEPHDVLEEVLTLDEIKELFQYCIGQVTNGVNEVKKP